MYYRPLLPFQLGPNGTQCEFIILMRFVSFLLQRSQINAIAADTLQTPLHVAIKAQKLAAVQMLVQLDANVEAVDANHDTMYHCAAITTKDIIKVSYSSQIGEQLLTISAKSILSIQFFPLL